LATDGPGFGTDEDIHHLGESLFLPAFPEAKGGHSESLNTEI